MMRRLSPRELKRLSKRMGLQLGTLEGVEEVIIRLKDKELVFKKPEVSTISVQGQYIYQIIGKPEERPIEIKEEIELEISDEDVQLVAVQAGVSEEEARSALKETGGDIAQAIILLNMRKRGY